MLNYMPISLINQSLQTKMSCADCAKLEKKIRVMQSDFDFELRKLSEDKSTEKALFEINLQKDIRKWQEKYNKERLDHEENSKKWLQKIDSVTLECQRRISEIQSRCQQAIIEVKEKTEKQILEIRYTTDNKLASATKKLSDKHQQQTAYKENYYQQMIESAKHSHHLQVENLKRIYNQREEKMKNEYQSCILGLRSQKNVDERNNLKLQEEFRVEKTKLISEIYDYKCKLYSSEEKIKDLKNIVKDKEDLITQKEQSIKQLMACHEQTISEMRNKHEKELLDQQIRMEEKMKEFYENQLRITEKYELSINKIQQNRQAEMELYRHNVNQIRNCVENRPSRLEDIEQILALKDKLAKKQKQYQALQRELKDYQLQLQNKEDTYNKIFIPTINSTHLPGQNVIKRKELKMKRPAGRSVTTVRQILNSVNINSNNLPLLNNLDKKVLLPPKSTKIL